MCSMNYYNEFDKKAAAWLRELIAQDLIPAGDVDERSITDVDPNELTGYRQLHFFAGVGGWPLACRLAGWPDSRQIVTGSCPCQPFSVAGKGAGTADERHLWPDFFRIIHALRPPVIMGEQVAAAVGKGWFLGVRSDLESIGYDTRGIVVPACAVNAPHRRDRLWFAAGSRVLGDLHDAGSQGHAGHESGAPGWPEPGRPVAATGRGNTGGRTLANTTSGQHEPSSARPDQRAVAGRDGEGHAVSDVANAVRPEWRPQSEGRNVDNGHDAGRDQTSSGLAGGGASDHWSGARWLIGHDGKARRVEPSIPLLVDGLPARAPLLRGYGNAIVPQIAAEMMAAWLEEFPETTPMEQT